MVVVIITGFSGRETHSKQRNYELWKDTDRVASIQKLKTARVCVSDALDILILGNH